MSQLCKLFIGGLCVETNDDGLRKHFEQFGTLIDHVVIRHKLQHRSRCFGFVTYSKPEEANAALAAGPHTVEGNAVEVKRAVAKENVKKLEAPANAIVKKIFVGGLKNDIEEDHLTGYFSQYGQVEKSEIMSEMETGKKRGFGFVHFTDHGSADKAVVEKFHTINGHRVEVKKAVAKQEMQENTRTGATARVMPSQDTRGNQNGYSSRDNGKNNGYGNGGNYGYGNSGSFSYGNGGNYSYGNSGSFSYGNGGNYGYGNSGSFSFGNAGNYGYGNGGGYGGYRGYEGSYRCVQENGYGGWNGYNNFGSNYGQGFPGYGPWNGPFGGQGISAPYPRNYGGGYYTQS